MRVQVIVVSGLALLLAACDGGGSAVATRERSTESGGNALSASSEATPSGPDSAATPEVKPVLTANRRETVDEKITRLYERNGAAFGARSAEDYLSKLQAFVSNPPGDAESVRRPNGDTLYYQASTNTFVVVDRSGVARTMFKPDGGAAYWAEQKTAAPTFGQRRQDN